MTAQDTHGFISLEKRDVFVYFKKFKNIQWRSKQKIPLKSFAQIKGGITDSRNSSSIAKIME
jgi:hypothetical protein